MTYLAHALSSIKTLATRPLCGTAKLGVAFATSLFVFAISNYAQPMNTATTKMNASMIEAATKRAAVAAQGGDRGALVTEQTGVQVPPELLGIHVNLPSAVSAEIAEAFARHIAPAGLSADESKTFERLDASLTYSVAYAQMELRDAFRSLRGVEAAASNR